jgi:hypothetical protein
MNLTPNSPNNRTSGGLASYRGLAAKVIGHSRHHARTVLGLLFYAPAADYQSLAQLRGGDAARGNDFGSAAIIALRTWKITCPRSRF